MIIKDEHDYLVHLINSTVHGTVPQEKPDNLSFEKVLEYGLMHDVANFAYPSVIKLGKKPSESLLKKWEEYYYIALRRDAIQQSVKDDVLSVFHENGISTLELQGTKVKEYYPSPDYRMMSDIDIIVRPEHLEKAKEILASRGFKIDGKNNLEIGATNSNNITLEIHTDFFSPDSICYKILKNPYDFVTEESGYTANVSDTVFYLFHLLHCLKHFVNSGVGIRRITDIYYLERALKDTADMEEINRILEENGLKEYKDELVALADYWFDGKPVTNAILIVADEVKTANRHGASVIGIKHKAEAEKKSGKKFPRLRSTLKLFFAPKEQIYKAYPFCAKHHLPAFLCRIYRAFCILFSPAKKGTLRRYIKCMTNMRPQKKD